MNKYVVGLLALLLTDLLLAGICRAAEYALIVGGGNSSASNPASLERQVLQALDVLAKRKFTRVDVLFADGDSPESDVVVEKQKGEKAESPKQSRAISYLRRLYGPAFNPDQHQRNHRVPAVYGAATLENLEAWFRKQGAQLETGDELLVYFATHGTNAAGDLRLKSEPAKSHLLLWNGGRLSVDSLTVRIGQLPQGVQVRLLITACYSGGFAEIGWPNDMVSHDTGLAATQLPVAGFFATSEDRPAAGCTSEADSPTVRDYPTCFWSALAGAWPDGQPVNPTVDLNGDGSVSYSEAHAFALVTDTTLDTPLKTSDIALRKISRFGRAEETRLMGTDPAYQALRAAASPAEQQLLDQLCLRLDLTEQRRLSKARTELRRTTFELKVLAEKRMALDAKVKESQLELLSEIDRIFPAIQLDELPTPEKIQQFLDLPGEKLEQSLTALPLWKRLIEHQTQLTKIDAERLELEVLWAAHERFLQTAESVILAHNLPLVVEDQAVLQRFEALKEAENSPLGDTR